jgi:hypothetical protein
MNVYISLGFEMLSLLASLALFFQKGVPRYFRLFPFFLAVMIAVELYGMSLNYKGSSNILLFNFFGAFAFEFYLFILWNIIQRPLAKKIVLGILIAYPLAALINILYIQTNSFHSYTFSVGCLLIVGVCVYYFLELFQLPKSIDLLREPAFWICSGLLFFYSCTFPLFALTNYLYSASNIILRNLSAVLIIINILLYALFTIAFLCRLRLKKLS